MRGFWQEILIGGFILGLLSPLVASTQTLIWDTNCGSRYNDFGNAGLPTADGNYLLLGSTFSSTKGDFDIYLVTLNSAGDTIRTTTFGGDSTEYGYDISSTHESGYIIVGSTTSFGAGKRDVYIIKVDSLGTVIWSRTIGGPEDDEGAAVRATRDGGFIICGTTNSYGAGYGDLYLIKTNAAGDTVWTRAFGGAGGESGSAVRETVDGGFIAVGSTGSFGEGYSSIYVVRCAANGDSLWAKTYGGSKADFGSALEITSDGGYVVAGGTASFGAGYADAYLIRLDSLGNFIWQNTYGGTKDDRAYAVCLAGVGGYLLAGTTESFSGTQADVFIIRTDSAGNQIWSKNYGGAKSDYGRAVFQDQQKDYIVSGYSYSYTSSGSDIYVLKIKGDSTSANGGPTSADGDLKDLLPADFALSQNYPNPFNMTTRIAYSLSRRSPVDLTIFNILGQDVRKWSMKSQSAGTYSVEWDGSDKSGKMISSGIYLCRFSVPGFTQTRKIVVMK